MKIYIGLNGEGLGHYARAVSIYEEIIKHGYEAIMATYGQAYQKAIAENVQTIEVKQEIAMSGQGGSFSLLKTLWASLDFPFRFFQAYRQEKKIIKNYDIVISDCRVATIFAAHQLKKPVFLVCNQTTTPKIPIKKTGSCLKDLKNKTRARLAEWAMTVSCMIQYHWADQIFIGDFQAPNTIVQPLISQRKKAIKKTSVIGPLNRLVNGYEKKSWQDLGFSNNNQPNIFMTIGGQGFRAGLVPKLLTVAQKLQANVFFSHFSIKEEKRENNLLAKPFDSNVYAYMASADLVVIPAGHSGVMELLIMGLPGVLIPDGGQPEQISNAQEFKKLGFGDYLLHEETDQLKEKINFVLKNLNTYQKKLSQLNQLTQTTDHGPKNVLKKINQAYQKISKIT